MKATAVKSTCDKNALLVGQVIAEALCDHRYSVYATAKRRWEIADSRGNLQGFAKLSDGWAILDFPVTHSWSIGQLSCRHSWSLLARNGRLRTAKYVIEPQSGQCHLRADIPIDDPSAIEDLARATLINTACKDLVIAHTTRSQGKVDRFEVAGKTTLGEGSSLLQQCEQARWPGVESQPGRIRVDLAVPGAFYQATAQNCADGIRLSVHIPCGNPLSLSMKCRWSLGLMLLLAVGMLRFVSASVGQIKGDLGVQFHVLLPHQPDARLLDHAFAALSTACRLYADKIEALSIDVALASTYLEVLAESNRKRGPLTRVEASGLVLAEPI